MGSDGTPHGYARREGWPGVRVAEVNVLPAQGPGFLGPDPRRQAQGDVGVHPGAVRGRQECGGLLQGQALARPPGLALRGFDEHGDVAPDEIAGLRMPDRPRQCVVAHGYGGTRVASGHCRQRLVHIAGRQFAQSPGADRGQDRGQDVLVLLDGLGGPAVEAFGQPVFGRAPDGIVWACLDACVEVAVKRLEPVLDDRFGVAGDLASDPFAVWTESEADHSPPPALAMPVPVVVTARAIVLEEDPVLAPATS